MQRIEFTKAYREETDRLIAALAKAEKVYRTARAEYKRCECALERHFESRHDSRAIA